MDILSIIKAAAECGALVIVLQNSSFIINGSTHNVDVDMKNVPEHLVKPPPVVSVSLVQTSL